jgi:hypothetical protein
VADNLDNDFSEIAVHSCVLPHFRSGDVGHRQCWKIWVVVFWVVYSISGRAGENGSCIVDAALSTVVSCRALDVSIPTQ